MWDFQHCFNIVPTFRRIHPIFTLVWLVLELFKIIKNSRPEINGWIPSFILPIYILTQANVFWYYSTHIHYQCNFRVCTGTSAGSTQLKVPKWSWNDGGSQSPETFLIRSTFLGYYLCKIIFLFSSYESTHQNHLWMSKRFQMWFLSKIPSLYSTHHGMQNEISYSTFLDFEWYLIYVRRASDVKKITTINVYKLRS